MEGLICRILRYCIGVVLLRSSPIHPIQFTVKSPESYLTRSYVARNFIMPNNIITCFVSSNVKEQDILLIYYRACFASSSSLKERDTLLCYTLIPPVSSHHSIIA